LSLNFFMLPNIALSVFGSALEILKAKWYAPLPYNANLSLLFYL
jgi:hypothetical protein